ncbi:MAG: 3-phosphoserine/phosphohydroxythreonine transaminase [Planctomycetes bacterium]|nr:3-phosphoserine/phosphohydroxythreonine transaminase [Planctomycetota bacterium]
MAKRIYNFSAGPAVLPVPVLDEAREALLSLGESGIGILEHSHRGPEFLAVYEDAVDRCRRVALIPDGYDVLFLQGGASLQFAMVPMNFLAPKATADYLVTGAWSQKAVEEAELYGHVHVAASSADANFSYIPREIDCTEHPAYVHFTSNNTIFGTQFSSEPEILRNSFLVCDASSDIFSRTIDVRKYGIIYAGAQKNLGPAGLTLVIIRRDLVESGNYNLPTMLQYRTHADNQSMFNTPPTFAIYVLGLVLKWIVVEGGLEAIERRNREKAAKLYAFLDESRIFKGTARPDSRSQMNVTFVTGDAALDKQFLAAAEREGLSGLKGHRSVGGMRASIYNAFPPEGVDALVDLMRRFEAEHV